MKYKNIVYRYIGCATAALFVHIFLKFSFFERFATSVATVQFFVNVWFYAWRSYVSVRSVLEVAATTKMSCSRCWEREDPTRTHPRLSSIVEQHTVIGRHKSFLDGQQASAFLLMTKQGKSQAAFSRCPCGGRMIWRYLFSNRAGVTSSAMLLTHSTGSCACDRQPVVVPRNVIVKQQNTDWHRFQESRSCHKTALNPTNVTVAIGVWDQNPCSQTRKQEVDTILISAIK